MSVQLLWLCNLQLLSIFLCEIFGGFNFVMIGEYVLIISCLFLFGTSVVLFFNFMKLVK